MKIINKSRVDFKYKASCSSPIIAKTIFSNTVDTTIIKDTLTLEHSINKQYVSIYDTLLYKIVITNISDEVVKNINIKEVLPSGIKFIENSVFVNDIHYKCCNIVKSCDLGNLDINSKFIITYKCVVGCFNSNILDNYCVASFDYIYNIEKPPLRFSLKSNDNIIVVKNNVFKQIILYTRLNISNINNLIKQSKVINVKINIIETKLINYPLDNNMINLILLGSITYRICDYAKIEGFSEVILLPRGAKYFNEICVETYKENINYFVKNNCEIFISVPALIFVSTKEC